MRQHPLESLLMLSSLMHKLLLPVDNSVALAYQSEGLLWNVRSCFVEIHPPIARDWYPLRPPMMHHFIQTKYLFLGAKPNARRLHLQEFLQHLLLLECEDPRDKIYGIRSLIAWSRNKAPTPDYSKDVFVLAKEVIESLYCDKPSENFY